LNLKSYEKGKRFENFIITLFSQLFKVVSHNLFTENGEIDVVLEITNQEPFWIEFGGDVFVECKNWNKNIPLNEVTKFCHKVSQARLKLGFIVSVNGFTNDAIRTLKNDACNINAPLVVPISGTDIEKSILKREKFDEFLKEKIRNIKYVRKY